MTRVKLNPLNYVASERNPELVFAAKQRKKEESEKRQERERQRQRRSRADDASYERLLTARKRNIEKATSRSDYPDGVGPRTRPTDHRARRRRASGR